MSKKINNINDGVENLKLKKISSHNTINKYSQAMANSTNEKFQARAKRNIENISQCYNSAYLEVHKHKANGTEKQKSRPFSSCRNKFCHICCGVRSRKMFVKTLTAIEEMKNDGIDFLGYHLTLTIKNPSVENYTRDYKNMNKAFDTFIHKYPGFKKYLIGFQAGRETTQSPVAKTRNELHPHIHVLLLLKSEFVNSKNVNSKTIKEFWVEKCAYYGLVVEPWCVKFEKIKVNPKHENTEGVEIDPYLFAIGEVSKYPAKPADIQKMNVNTFEILDNSLFGKRQMSYGGELKKYIAKVADTEILKEREFKLYRVIFLNWQKSNYNQTELSLSEIEIYTKLFQSKTLAEQRYQNVLVNGILELKKQHLPGITPDDPHESIQRNDFVILENNQANNSLP